MWSILQKLWQKLRWMWSPPSGAQSRPRANRSQSQTTQSQTTQSQATQSQAPSQPTRASSQAQRATTQTQQTGPKMQETWTKKQRIRLAVENKILAARASQFSFYKHTLPAETYVAGCVKTSDGHKYELKVLLGPKFPDKIPKMYVVSPHKVPKYGGGFVNDIVGSSHKFHAYGNGPDGCVEICHYNSSSWDPSKTIMSILLKGVIWCEGHCRHLKNGKTIAEYCNELRDQVPDLNNY